MDQELNEEVKKYMSSQQNLETLDAYRQNLEANFQDLKLALNALKEIKNSENLDDIYFPVGSGIVVPGSINKRKGVLINIGSNTFVRKNLSEAIKITDQRIENMKKLLEEVEKKISENLRDLSSSYAKIKKMQARNV